ncbi:MAG: GNAT family N-acetyltransferase [Deltaproteobacteria bacterium]|nr:GNAT family N-acetyltransferase [Deltaproteobacteria bacterium]
MTELPVRIEGIRIRDLVAFARNVAADPAYADTSPTCLLRAASQSVNPHAAPDDFALLVAYHAGRCVGYQGLLPGALRTADGLSKVSWLITFYVAPVFRGRGIGARLVREALSLNVDLVATGVTRAAEKAYRAAGFRDLGELACRRFSVESYPRPVRWLVYALICGRLRDRWPVRPVACISTEAARGWECNTAVPRFPRCVATVNWMLTHPWVVSRPDAAPDVPAYYFSSVRDLFRFEAYEVGSATDESRGAFVLSATRRKGRTQIKLLDGFFPDPALTAAAGIVALRRARDLLAHRIEFPLSLEGFLNGSRLLRRLTRRKSRLTLCHPRDPESPLAGCAGKIRLDYCDGDSAFT